MNNLSKLMRNYESAKSHILTMSYEINKDNLNDVNKLESIMNCFFWCFSKEETNFVKDLQYTYKSLKEAERKLRGIDYSSEIKNLKNRLNNLPNYKFLTNYYIDEFIADASMGLQGAKEVYLITNYYGYAFLYTNKTSFKTKGAFSMYVKVVPANGAKSTLPEQAQKAYKSANISSLFVEVSDEEYRRNEEEKKSLINQIDELEQGVSTFNNLKHGIENKIDKIKSDLSKNFLYDIAVAEFNNKNYEEASKIFSKLKGFKDSDKKLLECGSVSIYDLALNLIKNKNYQEAINKFKSIDGFKDSANKIHECENGLLQLSYESANDLLNKNKFEKAIKAFESIINYKDSKQKIKECEKRQLEHFVKTFDIKMVLCPAGSFIMGSPESEKGRCDDEKQHKVFLSKPFAIGKYEVTQNQYKAIMGKNPSYFKGDNNPVESVKWEDTKEFCNKLNAIYADKLPKGYKFDLPTEAQWEYACRAGTTTKYCNGDSDDKLGEVAWYGKNSEYKTHHVGQKKPNAWGIHDMHGNILELCRDRYEKNYLLDDVIDPVLPYNSAINGTFYVVKRGGDCDCESVRVCRSAYRERDAYKLEYLGFRLALVPIQ